MILKIESCATVTQTTPSQYGIYCLSDQPKNMKPLSIGSSDNADFLTLNFSIEFLPIKSTSKNEIDHPLIINYKWSIELIPYKLLV